MIALKEVECIQWDINEFNELMNEIFIEHTNF